MLPAQTSIGKMFALLASALLAQAASGSWEAIGQIGGATQAIAAAGRFVYVGTGRRLVLLDAGNGLRELGHSQVYSDMVEGVAVQNKLAFVACGRAGVHIVDVSVPSAPAEVATVSARGPADGIAVAGTTLYVANGPYGLLLYDITKPSQPVQVGSVFPTYNVLKVAVSGGRAYLAAAGAGLLVADVSVPARPVAMGVLTTTGFSFDVAVAGNTAYLADGWAGLRSVNVADPSHPSENTTLKTGCWAMGIGLAGSQAYIADGCAGLAVVDVSNTNQPARIAQYSTDQTNASAVAVSGGVVYIADRNWGVRAVAEYSGARYSAESSSGEESSGHGTDWRPHPRPVETASHAFVSDVHDVDVQGNYAYVAAGYAGLRVIDLTEPSAPREVGAFVTESYATGIAVQGHYAYLVAYGGSGLYPHGGFILDVTDPTNPVQVGYLPMGERTSAVAAPWQIRVSGNYAYIADEAGIGIMDVTDPVNPQWDGSVIPNPGTQGDTATFHVAVDGTRAYSTGTPTFGVVDISNPLAPVLLSYITPNGIMQSVAAHGNRAYLVTNHGLTILDVSDGSHPTQIGSYNAGPAYGVEIAGNVAYVSVAGGLTAVDVSNPANPVSVAEFESPGFTYTVRSIGSFVYQADSEGGLVILPQAGSAAAAAPATGLGQSLGLDGVLTPYAAIAIESADDPLPAALAAPMRPAAGPACTVTASTDSGPGSVRDCLAKTPAGGTVVFDPASFPVSGQPTLIELSSPLQLDKGWVTLDASNAWVQLYSIQASFVGLVITSPGNVVKGLQMVGFLGGGIALSGAAAHNQIGGDRGSGKGPTGEGNVIWGNGSGYDGLSGANLVLDGPGVYDNLVAGNIVGPDAYTFSEANYAALEIVLRNGASWNRIGGASPEDSNVIGAGSLLFLDEATSHNLVQGNSIGANLQGTAGLSTKNATFMINNASYNTVGGRDAHEGNLVAGSYSQSILLNGLAHGNQIIGNTIGLDITGSKVIALGGTGVGMEGPYDNLVEGNTIAGAAYAVTMLNFSLGFNQVVGNRLGFDPTGKVVLGNNFTAIIGQQAQFDRIGGSGPQDGNLIAGGLISSIYMTEGFGDIILGNHIGADVNGAAVASQTSGIELDSAARRFTVGGATAAEGNLVVGTPSPGITVAGKRHVVQGNVLGVDLQGTSSPDAGGIMAGMMAAGGPRDVIIQGNTAAGNSMSGIQSAFGNRSTCRRNSTYNDNGAGLWLNCLDAADCVTPPVLKSVGATNVSGTACANCEVEVFSDAGSQGRYFEASGIADSQGAFSIVLPNPVRGPNVTATATDSDGNTSAFSTAWQIAK